MNASPTVLRRKGRDIMRRAVYEVKTVVAEYPALAIPIARRRHGEPLGPGTRLVIEGFPRTSTSFAVAAFHLAQPAPVSVACHVHAPAQLIGAVRRGIPALVIVREPEETVLSFVIRNPHLSVEQALRGYLRFYEPLLGRRGALVVATFEQVTSDFGAVIRRVNERFGTRFAEFEHSRQNAARCLEEIDRGYRGWLPPGEALERQAARPSEWRAREKDRLRASYRAPGAEKLRLRAERVFRTLRDAAEA